MENTEKCKIINCKIVNTEWQCKNCPNQSFDNLSSVANSAGEIIYIENYWIRTLGLQIVEVVKNIFKVSESVMNVLDNINSELSKLNLY